MSSAMSIFAKRCTAAYSVAEYTIRSCAILEQTSSRISLRVGSGKELGSPPSNMTSGAMARTLSDFLVEDGQPRKHRAHCWHNDVHSIGVLEEKVFDSSSRSGAIQES